MRIFVMIIAMFFLLSCASTGPRDPLGIFAILDQELEKDAAPVNKKGWVVQDEDGYLWEFWAPQGRATIVLARCEYSYMKITGVEKWIGRYYNQTTSLWGDGMRNRPHWDPNLQGLSGCVSWVEHFMYGDYYI
jgi:hypothetical protein